MRAILTKKQLYNNLSSEVISCTKCQRLVKYREEIKNTKPKRFEDETYWLAPLPGFGDLDAKIFVIGLAPAKNGGSRTGRIFTGDRSGDFLFDVLFETGFSNQRTSISKDDSLELKGIYISAAVKCAPPQNKPTKEERDNCLSFLVRELDMFKENLSVIITLGHFAHVACAKALGLSKLPPFGHNLEYQLNEKLTLISSYHPSQQNTFTGRLTKEMLAKVFSRAKALADFSRPPI